MPATAPPARSPRKVLLALRAEPADARVLAAARGLAQRLGAELEILLRSPEERLPPWLDAYLAALRREGLPYSVTRRPGLLRRDIVRHANTHECVVAVLIDSLAAWAAIAADSAGNPWAKLSCPLVTALPGPA